MSWSGWTIHIPKWLPDYYPNDPWEIQSFPPQFDDNGNRKGPVAPPDILVPWWKIRDANGSPEKSAWPYAAPWGRKVLGAFQHARIRMPEDMSDHPSPFGHWRVNTPTERPHWIGSIKVNMPPESWLEVSPHPSLWAEGMYEATLREMVRKRPVTIVNADGSSIILRALRSPAWFQHQAEHRARKKAMRPKLESGNPDLFAPE